MGRDESNEEKKRKYFAKEDDIASTSNPTQRPRITRNINSSKQPTSSVVLRLGLLPSSSRFDLNSSPPPSPPSPLPLDVNRLSRVAVDPPTRVPRNQTQPTRIRHSDEIIPPPFPWATNRHAMVHTLTYLVHNQIQTIAGDVQCKRCGRNFVIEFDVRQKFLEVSNFIVEKMDNMHDRAPDIWLNPTLPSCRYCGQENCVKPLITYKNNKGSINWLFLLLGQWLGLCTIDQLKYFCKHTRNHRTGAKDRVLYATYIELCKQIYPQGPFSR
ncbi:hypothetical protein TanjilG_05382 [Lupinus angustifolius]|uniref:DUF7086 domain-containing protein n=1 Tax=Lupinus angustifolius TaxID=3871 RepID=A0A1J7IIK3_LUPAN|nr:PREDICTED: uncharacterized protein LOC109342464 [Lupinus angustifolius]OIW14761.1 hypothetical protein TanjilG_05382 [Lupinus angustifolius]